VNQSNLGGRIVGFNLKRFPEASDRLVRFPLVLQSVAQVVVSLRVIALDLQSPTVGGHCLVEPTERPIGFAQIVVVRCFPGPDCDRADNRLYGHLVPTSLVCNNAQQMQSVRIIRILVKYPLIDPFRVSQLAGLMMPNGHG
jgi:hypothetical protein